MFIAKNNDLIILANNSKEALEQQLQFMVYTSIEETEEEYELYNGSYLTQEEIAEKKLEQFNKDFFNTSLGWVRRKVSMQTGEIKDFLSDILPRLKAGVLILTYTIDGEQNKVEVTEDFINECDQQIIKDFYGE